MSERQEAQMKTAIDRILAGVTWEPLPPPAQITDGMPYATHSGELTLLDVKLRCYQLSDGERVFSADDVHALLGFTDTAGE